MKCDPRQGFPVELDPARTSVPLMIEEVPRMNTVWAQGYSIWGQSLAISAIVAALPIAVLLFLLGVRRKPAWVAGLCGLGSALLVALAGYRMPVSLTLSSAAYGAAFGLFP